MIKVLLILRKKCLQLTNERNGEDFVRFPVSPPSFLHFPTIVSGEAHMFLGGRSLPNDVHTFIGNSTHMKDDQLKALNFRPSNLSFVMKNSLLNVLIMLLTFIRLHFSFVFYKSKWHDISRKYGRQS